MTQSSLSAISTAELLKRKAQLEARKAPQSFSTLSTEELLRRKAALEQTAGGNRAASLVKSGVAGAVGGLADTATAPYNFGAAAHNFQREHIDQDVLDAAARFNPDMPSVPYDVELPLIPSATEAIDSGIDSLTGGYTQTPEGQRWLNEGVKFGASLASPGGLAKAGVKGMSALGTLRPAGLAGAFAAGATGEALRDKGAATSLGGSLGAGIATDLAARRLGGTALKKAGTSLAGFGQKRLNLDATHAAEKIGIDLPNAAATNAMIPKYMHTFISKTPYVGERLKEQYKTASGKFQESFEKMLDSVGPLKDEEAQALNNKAYEKMYKAIGIESDVPVDLEAMDKINITGIVSDMRNVKELLKSLLYSKENADVLQRLDSAISNVTSGIGELPKDIQNVFPQLPEKSRKQILEQLNVQKSPVLEVINTKRNISQVLAAKGFWTKETAGTYKLLEGLRKKTDELLVEYGKTQNPEFLKAWKAADKQFEKVAKRQTVQDLLSGKLEDPNTNEVKYKSLVKVLEDRNNQKLLKNTLGTTNYDKLKDFVTVAKSIGSIENVNPSGTAVVLALVHAAQEAVKFFATGDLSLLSSAASAAGEIGASYFVLTNKKFLNLATQFAKEPTLSRAQKLEKLFQEETGLSMQSLVQSVNKDRKSNK